MQKYKSNITTTSGAAVRGVPVLVIDEDGNNAALFLDRAGTVPAQNPLTTGPDGVFSFYAVNGRYSLRTTVDGVTITDDDVVLMMDPEEITVAGPIAEAVAAAQAAAIAAEFAVEASGIPDLVAAAQNAVVDSNNAVTQANSAANNAAISKTGADSARDAAVIAQNSAEAALDSFDDRYLGAKASAPATDNDGGALLTGALYWDTALPGMRSWNGTAWVTLPAATAAAISNTPAGSIAATTVQAALNELDTEKVAKTDVIAIAKGGTGATTANAAADAIGAFRRGTLLGTVSQSAGVPTGAVIERGSNANGEYVRFADGTQICVRSNTVNAVVAAGFAINSHSPASMAAAFVGPVAMSNNISFFAGAAGAGQQLYSVPFARNGIETFLNTGSSPDNALPTFSIGSTSANSYVMTSVATGRWY